MLKPASTFSKLVDLQVNGVTLPPRPQAEAKVVSFSSPDLSLETLRLATERLVSCGTDFFLATIITSSPEVTMRNAKVIAQGMKEEWGGPILGVHLEGPFLSQSCNGAHPFEHIKEQPDTKLFSEFFDAAEGNVILTTVSPALRNAPSFISEVCDMGVAVSLGHHDATAEQIEQAFDAGATGVTHAGNAWRTKPNKDGLRGTDVLAQLLGKGVYVMVIPDGYHVSPRFIHYVYDIVERFRPGHVIWVSDCSALATAPVGTAWKYDGITSTVVDDNGELKPLPLSGSYLLIKDCLSKLHSMNVVPAEGILPPASVNPLKFIEAPLVRCGTFPISHTPAAST